MVSVYFSGSIKFPIGKIFLLTNINVLELTVNLKCDPELAVEWREKYASVVPGYHMNKKLWNTVSYNGEFSSSEFLKMIDHSYCEVVKKLPKKIQTELQK